MFGAILRTLAVICLSLGGSSCLEQASFPEASDQATGLVVESVPRNSVAEKAGLQEGDILLAWTHGGKSGDLLLPFELTRLEIELAPRGIVTLFGRRGRETRTWQLGDESWGVKVRPKSAESLISAGTDEAEKNAGGIQWQNAADQALRQGQSPALVSWLLFRSAEALANKGMWDEAEAACQQSVQSWPAAEVSLLPYLLKGCGDAFYLREPDQKHARQFLTQALETSRRQDQQSLTVASIFSSLGRIDLELDDLSHAEQRLLETLRIQEHLVPGTLSFAFTLNRLGVIYQYEGKLDEAKALIGRALELREKLVPGSQAVAFSLENYGNILTLRGETSESAAYLARACQLHEQLAPESLTLAACFVDAGTVASVRQDIKQAEEYLQRALALQRKLSPRGGGASSSLNNLGLVFLDRGQFAEAEKCFQEALSIKQENSPDSLDVAITLSNLGLLNLERGTLGPAHTFLQKARAIREKLAPDSIELGIIYEHLGRIATLEDDPGQAEEYLGKALAVIEKASPVAIEASNAHQDLGDLAVRKGDLARAEKEYELALRLREKSVPGSWLQAESLMAMGNLKRRLGDLAAASKMLQQGLDAVETQTARLGSSDLVRADFLARYEQAYKVYIELLIDEKKPGRAFEVLERSRARTLLETLAAARVDLQKGADPVLLQQERVLQADLAGKTSFRLRLLETKHTEEKIAAVDREIGDLVQRYEALKQQVRTSSPAYAALAIPRPLTIEEARSLLDDDTLLLEYSLGQERSSLFLVSQHAIRTYELPGRDTVEKAARAFYELITDRNRGPLALRENRTAGRGSAPTIERAAAELSTLILKPAARELGEKRLLIVCDGALHYVPFAALADPKGPAEQPVPLMVGHEIVYLPSASVLATLRQQNSSRHPAPKMVAVLADPVFSAEDPRLRDIASPGHNRQEPQQTVQPDSDDRLTRSMRDVGMTQLSRLPYTRREAAAIGLLAPKSQQFQALDFGASRATALSSQLAQYRIVHLATHALLNSDHPELSGLVLSLVSERGKPITGFLSLEDIYNMNLPANLVVLSACETALGKQIKGEGMIGLTRGFMYAGATRVLASIWMVSDVGTSRLMADFYSLMLREHLPAPAALRQAQIKMWKEPRWSSPYYWAAFELQGEFK